MEEQDALSLSATRRSFLLGLAAAAALPALPEASLAQASPSGAPGLSSADTAEIDALMAIVSLRYGSYLKSDEVPLVRRALERQRAGVVTLGKLHIDNSDAPDCLFIPDGR
jgi:hypothetical protein